MIPNGKKLTSPIPQARVFKLGISKEVKGIITGEQTLNTRRSIRSNRSNLSDRVVNYQNSENAQFEQIMVPEQFNLNNPSWGEAVSATGNRPKPGTTKYSNNISKHAANQDFLVTKRRVLNHKRRDFWNFNLSTKTSLPPPPMGKSLGHGILKLSQDKGYYDEVVNVSLVSK